MKNSELKKNVDAFHLACREAGLRVTPQRLAIYKALLESDEHPSATTVFHKIREVLPAISLDTVNRTLLTLSEIGVAFIVEGSGSAKRFDANLDSHQHFRCIKCERIIDLHHKPFDNISIPKNFYRGLVILRKTVYFEGICDLCVKKHKSRRSRNPLGMKRSRRDARRKSRGI